MEREAGEQKSRDVEEEEKEEARERHASRGG
jgi:hypothetical protein